jgi:RimJ/RimL family protein N-acetyltransferase
MRLEPVSDFALRDRLLHGELDGYDAAPGWPHPDSAAGLSFLDSGGEVFLVIDDDGRIAGECGTKTGIDPRGAVEIGYGLAAPSRGKGLGGAAVGALLDLLRANPGIRVVEAEVHHSNDPSWRILHRLGFRPTGTVINGFGRFILELSP